ncbi:BMP family ABC transporter substrate-binding protein, partial [bacterium]|nr:BMP family ABC transporter substrate-binding protein [bacterium]
MGVYDMLNALTVGDVMWLGGGTYVLDAANGGISFAPTHDADVPQEVIDLGNEVLALLASGELETGIDPLTGELLAPPA